MVSHHLWQNYVWRCDPNGTQAFWCSAGEIELPVNATFVVNISAIRKINLNFIDVLWCYSKSACLYQCVMYPEFSLTHWGRVTHICIRKLNIIGSDNGLSPGRRQAIILINAALLLIWPLGTNFSEMLIEIHIFTFKKMHLKMSSAKWRSPVNSPHKGTVTQKMFPFDDVIIKSVIQHESYSRGENESN